MDQNLPQAPGYYWARSEQRFKWYDMIIHVYGEAPFFRMEGWKLSGSSACCGSVDLSDIADFGPQIEHPEVPPERIMR